MANTQKQDNDVLQSKCKSCAIIIMHIYSKHTCIYQEHVAEVIKHSFGAFLQYTKTLAPTDKFSYRFVSKRDVFATTFGSGGTAQR